MTNDEREWIKFEDAMQEVYQHKLKETAETLEDSKGATWRNEHGFSDLPLVNRNTMAEAKRHLAEAFAAEEIQLFHKPRNCNNPRSRDPQTEVFKLGEMEARQLTGLLPFTGPDKTIVQLSQDPKYFLSDQFQSWLGSEFPQSTESRSPGRPSNKSLDQYEDWITAELKAHRPFNGDARYRSGRAFARAVQTKIKEETGIVEKEEAIRSRVRRILRKIDGIAKGN